MADKKIYKIIRILLMIHYVKNFAISMRKTCVLRIIRYLSPISKFFKFFKIFSKFCNSPEGFVLRLTLRPVLNS